MCCLPTNIPTFTNHAIAASFQFTAAHPFLWQHTGTKCIPCCSCVSVRFVVFFRLVVRTHIACLCVCFAVPLSFPAEQINLCPSSYAPFLTEAAQRREMMKQIQNSIACVLF